MAKTIDTKNSDGRPSLDLVTLGVPTAAVANSSNLAESVRKHKAAFQAFEATFGRENSNRALYLRLSDAEEDAVTAICAYRPKTGREGREKAEYLAAYFERNPPIEPQISALLWCFAD
ncbi:hypothetical protein [Rhodoblastus sp.]|uniref:hypothetical protein n=1 Tax=Rhodoblastus sp. TaxID=1962975 RepID=UPI003F965B9F